jgi:2-hydroxy-3-keto-5-methylthiopentenyl-1-phosphate phosphatase
VNQAAGDWTKDAADTWAVLCDFDGTVVACETVTLLYRRFAAPSCTELVEQWMRGEIGTQEELQGCFATMKASRGEMEAVLDSVSIDPGFPSFVESCRQRGHAFALVSDGLTWIIDHILARHGIQDVTIYANSIHFEPQGIRLSFPWHDPQYPKRGVPKPIIVRRYQAQGWRVAYIGDGLTDLEVLGVADVVYARDRLLDHAREQGMEVVGFSGFSELLGKRPFARG